MRWGVVTFPGSLDDHDALYAIDHVLGAPAVSLWHKQRSLQDVDCVVLPGGFSYGDYLRCGAMARFSPVMESVAAFARDGGLVLGICNGFQVLCEAGLLPGALTRNRDLSFVCSPVYVRVDNASTPFTNAYKPGEILSLPIKHGEGCYVADEETLRDIEEHGQVLLRYVDASGRVNEAGNPNGSLHNIAGVCNRGRNVFGLMPHPEHAVEKTLGSGDDGLRIFRSIAAAIAAGRAETVASVVPGH